MYTTQMNAARQGIITKEMEEVAAQEKIDMEVLRGLVAKGQVVIPANKNHKCLKAHGIGKALKTKINVNLGTSKDCLDSGFGNVKGHGSCQDGCRGNHGFEFFW